MLKIKLLNEYEAEKTVSPVSHCDEQMNEMPVYCSQLGVYFPSITRSMLNDLSFVIVLSFNMVGILRRLNLRGIGCACALSIAQ